MNRRAFLVSLLALPVRAEARAPRIIALQPLGKGFTRADIDVVRGAFERTFDFEIRVLKTRPLPAMAWTEKRRRWRAEKLLDHLETLLPSDAWRIVGLTASDISTTKGKIADYGIMGKGRVAGATCVVSRYRLGKGGVGRKKRNERLAKIALHELGHTLGLHHCPTKSCLMEDVRGTMRTVDRWRDFCASCRTSLEERGVVLL